MPEPKVEKIEAEKVEEVKEEIAEEPKAEKVEEVKEEVKKEVVEEKAKVSELKPEAEKELEAIRNEIKNITEKDKALDRLVNSKWFQELATDKEQDAEYKRVSYEYGESKRRSLTPEAAQIKRDEKRIEEAEVLEGERMEGPRQELEKQKEGA